MSTEPHETSVERIQKTKEIAIRLHKESDLPGHDIPWEKLPPVIRHRWMREAQRRVRAAR